MALFLCMTLLFSGCGAKKVEETAKVTESAEMTQAAEGAEGTGGIKETQEAEETDESGAVRSTQATENIEATEDFEEARSTETAQRMTQGKGISSGTKSNTGTGKFATPATSGALQVVGAQLCDENGNPVQLRGLSTHGIGWFPEYVNSELFSQFRNEWNVNVIRLAMYTAEGAGYCTGGDSACLKELIDTGVKAATENDMYVIIDWHILSDGNPQTYQSQAMDFFAEMSEKYAKNNNVLYEICNEPNGGTSWSAITAYAEEIIPVIRENDPDAVIIVGTPTWSQDVDQAVKDPLAEGDNIMYALHFYAATHKEALRSKMTAATEAGLPIFVTEYGICDASGNGAIDYDSANQWVESLNEYGISYCAWSICNKNETCSIFKSSCQKTKDMTEADLSESGSWQYQMLSKGNGSMAASALQENSKNTSKQQENQTQNQETPEKIPSSKKIADGTLEITATVTGSWQSNGKTFYQYAVSIQNNGDTDVNGWAVDLSFNETLTLTDQWNGDYTTNGNLLHISGKEYNSTIPAGGSVSDVGFIVSGSSNLAIQ